MRWIGGKRAALFASRMQRYAAIFVKDFHGAGRQSDLHLRVDGSLQILMGIFQKLRRI